MALCPRRCRSVRVAVRNRFDGSKRNSFPLTVSVKKKKKFTTARESWQKKEIIIYRVQRPTVVWKKRYTVPLMLIQFVEPVWLIWSCLKWLRTFFAKFQRCAWRGRFIEEFAPEVKLSAEKRCYFNSANDEQSRYITYEEIPRKGI